MTIGKVGMYGGKFLPFPHLGHVYAMIRASTMVDELHVVVSYDEVYEKILCEKGGKVDHVDHTQRLRWWTQLTKDLPHVHVHAVYEEQTGELVDWEFGASAIKQAIGKQIDVVFSSEHSYTPFFNRLYPDAKHEVIDSERETYNISGTKIREEGVLKHWNMIPKVVQPYFAKKVVVVGTESCVDGETEYFNGSEWKRMSEYVEGDNVLQFNEDFTANLVSPQRYIKVVTDKMYQMSNSYGTWKQVMSLDHDVVYLTSKGNLSKKPFGEIMKSHFESKHGFQGKIINSFNFDGDLHIEENKLRLMIAISADGSKARNKWRVRVKKKHKVERMRELIKAVGLELDERLYSGKNEEGFSNFYLPLEYGVKEFPKNWVNLDRSSKDIFIEEIIKWDGHKNCYYSSIKNNVDIAQFIISSCGKKANVREDVREGRSTVYRVEISSAKYSTVDVNKTNEHKRHEMMKEFTSHDGYMYCFTVNSGMLVLRRDDKIFVTGNCGKSTLVKNLATMYNTTYVEEFGRTYYERLGDCEGVTMKSDYAEIAFEHKYNEKIQLQNANKVLFIDTEAVVTQYYSKLYVGEYQNILTEVIKLQEYDMWIFLEPDVKWVDDGQRTFGEQEVREHNNRLLKHMLKCYGIEYITVSGNYQYRLEKVVHHVNELLEMKGL